MFYMPQGCYLPEGILLNTTKNKLSLSSLKKLERAMYEGAILEARVKLCDSSHNLIVDLNGIPGIIPREEAALGIAEGSTREIAVISRVGCPVSFKITEITGGDRPRVILSRRLVQKEALTYFMLNLDCGDVIRARVTHLEPFGAFVDIGCGIISLIGIENISVSRISHPGERFYTGQNIYAVVLSKDQMLSRITLSHKELLGTWEENASYFNSGETVRGMIRGIEDYGVFVELLPNLSGLAERKEGLSEGQPVSVYIKSIIPERMQIKLIIIDALTQQKNALPEDLHYFITGGKLTHWVYTPASCPGKRIEKAFL